MSVTYAAFLMVLVIVAAAGLLGKLDALLDHHVSQRAPPSALHSEW